MPLVPDNPRAGCIFGFTRPLQALHEVVITEQRYACDAIYSIMDVRHLGNIREIRTNRHFTGAGQAHWKPIIIHDESIFQNSPGTTGADPQGRT